jgi:hypothetical protein
MTRTLPTPVHVRPTYASCGLSPYMATFRESSTGLDGCTDPEKKCSRLHLLARLSGPWDPPQFISQHSHWSSPLSQAPVGSRLQGLPGPYHRHAVGTFNTSSRVPTPRSLIDTGGGYHIENLRIATTLSLPFCSEGSTDPSNGPTRSPITKQHFTTLTGEWNKP